MAYILFAVSSKPEDLEPIECVAQFFAAAGHQTEVVHDGAAAGDRILTGAPDILVSDLYLPHQDGFELSHALRRVTGGRSRSIILGVVTAEVGGMLQLGGWLFNAADRVLIKPNHYHLERMEPRHPTHYLEQLIVSIGELLHRQSEAATTES